MNHKNDAAAAAPATTTTTSSSVDGAHPLRTAATTTTTTTTKARRNRRQRRRRKPNSQIDDNDDTGGSTSTIPMSAFASVIASSSRPAAGQPPARNNANVAPARPRPPPDDKITLDTDPWRPANPQGPHIWPGSYLPPNPHPEQTLEQKAAAFAYAQFAKSIPPARNVYGALFGAPEQPPAAAAGLSAYNMPANASLPPAPIARPAPSGSKNHRLPTAVQPSSPTATTAQLRRPTDPILLNRYEELFHLKTDAKHGGLRTEWRDLMEAPFAQLLDALDGALDTQRTDEQRNASYGTYTDLKRSFDGLQTKWSRISQVNREKQAALKRTEVLSTARERLDSYQVYVDRSAELDELCGRPKGSLPSGLTTFLQMNAALEEAQDVSRSPDSRLVSHNAYTNYKARVEQLFKTVPDLVSDFFPSKERMTAVDDQTSSAQQLKPKPQPQQQQPQQQNPDVERCLRQIFPTLHHYIGHYIGQPFEQRFQHAFGFAPTWANLEACARAHPMRSLAVGCALLITAVPYTLFALFVLISATATFTGFLLVEGVLIGLAACVLCAVVCSATLLAAGVVGGAAALYHGGSWLRALVQGAPVVERTADTSFGDAAEEAVDPVVNVSGRQSESEDEGAVRERKKQRSVHMAEMRKIKVPGKKDEKFWDAVRKNSQKRLTGAVNGPDSQAT